MERIVISMNGRELTSKYNNEAVQWRRWLHQHAELAWKEFETTDFIEEKLREFGLTPHRFACGTGCWTDIIGGAAGEKAKMILLRADIDAMPGTDVKEVPYKSIHEGAVHSCGHDSHVAMLLAAAKALLDVQDQLSCNVRLVFEPAEELGLGGAYCVSQGVLDNVHAAFAIHVWDGVNMGHISIKEGPCMAGGCAFAITVKGISNTTYPHLGGDTILAAARIIEGLELIKTTFTDSFEEPTDITLGKIHGGSARNTMADKVEIEGVVRTFYKRNRRALEDKIIQIAKCTAEMNNCTADVDIRMGLAPLSHDSKAMNELSRNAAIKVLGPDGPVEERASIGGDTFVDYMKVPGMYARLGCRVPGEEKYCHALHSDPYDMNDEIVVADGAALFAQVVLDFMNSNEF